MAYKYSGNENQLNRAGNRFNGKTYTLEGALTGTPLIPAPPGAITVSRGVDYSHYENDRNVFATKSEVDVALTFSNDWTGFVKFRGYYQPDVFEEIDDSKFVDGEGGQPNRFNVKNHGNEATYLSHSENNYMLDMPALYLDWANGPWWVRIGQQ